MNAVWTPGLLGLFGRPLGIELAGHTLIATTGRRLGTPKAAAVALPTSAPAGSMPIRAALRQQAIGAGRVHLVVCDPEHTHRTLLLPPMTRRERAEVVQREIARDGEAGRVAAWRRVRRVVVDGVAKDELLIVSAPAASLQHALAAVVGERLDLGVVVSGPDALMAAARALSADPLHRPVALVHWGLSSMTIAVVSDGVLRFTRMIEPPAIDLDPLEWFPVEIDRSLRHYAILSKGERVEQVMISVAQQSPAQRLFAGADLSDRLRLPVSNLNALIAPSLPPMRAGELAEGAFVLAYGAATSSAGEALNLLPHPQIVQRRSRRVVAAAVAVNVITVSLIVSEAVVASRDARSLRARLDAARAAQQAHESRLGEAGRIEGERAQARELVRLVAAEPLKQLPPADGLREIARLAPDQLRLDQITVSLDARGYLFRLAGGVERSDFVDAQRDLNQFYYGLRASPLFHDVQFQQGSLPAPGTGSAPSGERPVEETRTRLLPFVILLRARAVS